MENLQPLFDRKLQCPVCTKEYTSKKLRSKFVKVKSYDTDFCPTYHENAINGLFYNIYVCPHCGYAYSDDFSKYFPPATLERIQEKICSKWKPHDLGGERTVDDAIQTYKLASLTATLKKEKHVMIAGLYMRTAWLYRLKKNEEQEKRFLNFAIKQYSESFSKDDFKGTQVSEVRILYLLGELSKRVGNVDQAVKYLSMVIERQKSTIETNLIDMARERWHEIRDEQKKQD